MHKLHLLPAAQAVITDVIQPVATPNGAIGFSQCAPQPAVCGAERWHALTCVCKQDCAQRRLQLPGMQLPAECLSGTWCRLRRALTHFACSQIATFVTVKLATWLPSFYQLTLDDVVRLGPRLLSCASRACHAHVAGMCRLLTPACSVMAYRQAQACDPAELPDTWS